MYIYIYTHTYIFFMKTNCFVIKATSTRACSVYCTIMLQTLRSLLAHDSDSFTQVQPGRPLHRRGSGEEGTGVDDPGTAASDCSPLPLAGLWRPPGRCDVPCLGARFAASSGRWVGDLCAVGSSTIIGTVARCEPANV